MPISTQNHRTNIKIAKTSTRKFRKVKPSESITLRLPPELPGSRASAAPSPKHFLLPAIRSRSVPGRINEVHNWLEFGTDRAINDWTKGQPERALIRKPFVS